MQNARWSINISVAVVFGAVALSIVLAGFTIPIPGAGVVTDPREIFVTLGSALTGPAGALIIGFLAGVAEPGGIPLASLLAHVVGALWMALAYKKVVFERMQMPWRLAGWAILVVIYYYAFVLPGFAFGLSLFYGEHDPFGMYAMLGKGVLVELGITTAVTTLVILALPRYYQKPLW